MMHPAIIVAIYCVTIPIAIAQKSVNLNSYDMEDGLISSNVNTIFQDDDGFIWLVGENGINRFDGLRFKAYRTASRSGLLLKAKDQVLQDKKGNLLIDYVHGGFFDF